MKIARAPLPFRMPRSLRRQVILIFVAGAFVVIVAFVAYLTAVEQDRMYAHSTDQAFGLAEALKVSALPWVLSNDVAALQELVHAAANYTELRYAMVLTPEGRVLAHTDARHVGQVLADASSLAFLRGPLQGRAITDSTARIDVVLPLRFRSDHIGWVRLAVGREHIAGELRKLTWNGAFFVLVATLLSLLAARFVAHRLGTSIASLVAIADQVRGGNRQVRANTTRAPEEMAILGDSFNHMLDDLVESERLYRSLFEDVPISLWEEDFSGLKDALDQLRIGGVTDFQRYFDDHPGEVVRLGGLIAVRHVNSQTLRLFEAEDMGVLQRQFADQFVPESMVGLKAELVALAAGQTHFSCESPLRSLRGKHLFVRLDLIVPQGYEHTLARVLASLSDITERRQAEIALQTSEERYRIVADFTYDCEYWQAVDGRLLYLSQACETQTGYRTDEFIETPRLLVQTVHPDDRAAFEHHLHHTREVVGPANLDFRLIRRDGSAVWVNHVCRPVYGRNDEYLGRRVSNRDITERRALQSRLEEAAAYARSLFEATLDPMATLSLEGTITDVNKGGEQAIGLSREQLIGTDYVSYCTDPQQARKAFFQVLTAGYARDVNLNIRHVSGAVSEYLFNGVVLWDKDGKTQGILISARDVTELKRLERQLRELNESLARRVDEEVARSREKDLMLVDQAQQAAHELQAVNESLARRVHAEVAASRDKDHMLIQQSRLAAMGEMVHNIAHQWRQPLHAISLILGNLRDSYALEELTPEVMDETTQRAQALLQRMSKTIDDFRDFFRPDVAAAEFDISESVKDALGMMEATFQNDHIEVTASLPPGLKAYGHANQFAQAVLNVIGNAKEAIQQQKVADGCIDIRLTRADGRATLTIQDNGGGIAPETLPRIFDPYFTTKPAGSGIGLYMTKTIIERNLKGAITAANRGAGALITLSLPLVAEGDTA